MGVARRFPAFEHPEMIRDPSLKVLLCNGGEITHRRSPFSVVVSLGFFGFLHFNGSLGFYGSLKLNGSLGFYGSLELHGSLLWPVSVL